MLNRIDRRPSKPGARAERKHEADEIFAWDLGFHEMLRIISFLEILNAMHVISSEWYCIDKNANGTSSKRARRKPKCSSHAVRNVFRPDYRLLDN
jgi:hypothetical protein